MHNFYRFVAPLLIVGCAFTGFTMGVGASILEGRTAEQKVNLSTEVISTLTEKFPDVETIGIDIIDLGKATGLNRNML